MPIEQGRTPGGSPRQIPERWGTPDQHMAEYWSLEQPVIRLAEVPQETGAARMGEGFRLQKVVYTKNFMWDYDSMAPRLGTPFHSHYQDEAWWVVSGAGVFRTVHGAFRITPGDFIYLPGGERHQIANLSAAEPLVYQVLLVPPVTPESIIVDRPFDPSDLEFDDGS